jgi:hypothetical protein
MSRPRASPPRRAFDPGGYRLGSLTWVRRADRRIQSQSGARIRRPAVHPRTRRKSSMPARPTGRAAIEPRLRGSDATIRADVDGRRGVSVSVIYQWAARRRPRGERRARSRDDR